MLLERETLREVEPFEEPADKPDPEQEAEPDLLPFLAVGGMVVVITLIAVTLIAVCFLAAKLATGHAV
jgi:hypothetical protein